MGSCAAASAVSLPAPSSSSEGSSCPLAFGSTGPLGRSWVEMAVVPWGQPRHIPCEWRAVLRLLNGECRFGVAEQKALCNFLGIAQPESFCRHVSTCSTEAQSKWLWDELRDLRVLMSNGFVARQASLDELHAAVNASLADWLQVPAENGGNLQADARLQQQHQQPTSSKVNRRLRKKQKLNAGRAAAEHTREVKERGIEELQHCLQQLLLPFPDAKNPSLPVAELVRLRLQRHTFRGSDLEELLRA
eukprot:TRINITY_DN91918_c0_g1_i1.p1 TRINITY_DN91918_c0_g1~~TRINITY_DN91918_c0_g1_i1.p1  ORF type:complete len:247 (+),score=52.58 TRINITY_DN91918_c0_g1_i1:312-1052(+)